MPSFSFGERLGIFLMVESAGLSAVAVSILLSYVAYKAINRYRARKAFLRSRSQEWMNALQISAYHLEMHGGSTDASDSSFFIGLMLAELVQAIGGLLNIQWIIEATVTEGALCTAQGVLKQFGDVSVAFMSLMIAIQTFCVLVVRWHTPASASKYIIGLVFLFITLMIGISAATRTHSEKGAYYGNTGFWCWIGDHYKTEKIVFEYLWMWLTAFIMLIIYGIIALVMRGILVVGDESGKDSRWKLKWTWNGNGGGRDRLSTDDRGGEDEDEERHQAKAIANLMLFYPAVYIICVFPVGLVRWLVFSGHYVPPPATIFASIVFSLSGLLNTILYVLTRPELVRGDGEDPSGARRSKKTPDISTEKPCQPRSTTNDRNLGHLPDRDDGVYRQDHSSSPWLKSQHVKSDGGFSYSASPISVPSSNVILGDQLGASQDLNVSTTGAGSGWGMRTSTNEVRRQQLVSLDMGHLPENDLDRGGGPGTTVPPDSEVGKWEEGNWVKP